jgi:hypothetical protein
MHIQVSLQRIISTNTPSTVTIRDIRIETTDRRPTHRRAGAEAPGLAFDPRRLWLLVAPPRPQSSVLCLRRSAIVHKLNTSHGELETECKPFEDERVIPADDNRHLSGM